MTTAELQVWAEAEKPSRCWGWLQLLHQGGQSACITTTHAPVGPIDHGKMLRARRDGELPKSSFLGLVEMLCAACYMNGRGIPILMICMHVDKTSPVEEINLGDIS
jgi:hypothetical protein